MGIKFHFRVAVLFLSLSIGLILITRTSELSTKASSETLSTPEFGTVDVAVASIAPYKTIVGVGQTLMIEVTVLNNGTNPITANLTAHVSFVYAETIQIVNLGPNQQTTLNFTWNTTGVAKANYLTWAYAEPIAGENNTLNNLGIGAVVTVSMVGDLTGYTGYPDGQVDIRDLALIARYYGQNVPPAQPNSDINSDGKVDIKDIAMAARNYGKTDP